MGRAELSGTVRPSSVRPNPRRPGRSRDRASTAGPSLTPAGPQTRGEWEDQISDLTNRMLAIERNNQDIAQAVAVQDQILDGYRRGCTQIVGKITSFDAYAQAVDRRISEVDNLFHSEMSNGRDQLRELERVVSDMRGGVAGPDNYNISSPGGGSPQPPNGSRDLNQHFRTNPNLRAADQGRQAWQQAPPDARDAHRQGPPPQQQEFASVEVVDQQGAPGVHLCSTAACEPSRSTVSAPTT